MTKLIIYLVDSLYQLRKERKFSLPWTDFLQGSMEAGWCLGWWSLVLLLCWKCGGELVGCFLTTLGVFCMVPLGHVLHSRPLFQSNEDLSNNFHYLEVWTWEGGESNWIKKIKLCGVTAFKTLCVYASWIQTRIDQCKKHWHFWKEIQWRVWVGNLGVNGNDGSHFDFPQRPGKGDWGSGLHEGIDFETLLGRSLSVMFNSFQSCRLMLQRTSTLHLPEFVDKIRFCTAFMQEYGAITALFHMIFDLQCFCGAAEGLRQLSTLTLVPVISR